MTKHKFGYIVCGDNGPMEWEDDQLVYVYDTKARVQVFPTRQSANGAIKRSVRWREKQDWDAGLYWVYRLED